MHASGREVPELSKPKFRLNMHTDCDKITRKKRKKRMIQNIVKIKRKKKTFYDKKLSSPLSGAEHHIRPKVTEKRS